MQNYIQNGHVITVPAPAGGATSGEGMIVGNIFGIATISAAEGDSLELATTGVYKLPKALAAAVVIGARVAWDSTSKHVTIPGAGLVPIGVATEAAANGIASVGVRLDGVAVVAD